MKAKVVTLFLMILSFLVFFVYDVKRKQVTQYKILEVIQPDMFCIDINDNNKCDSGEKFNLKDIYAFNVSLNSFSKMHSKELGISELDYLKAGFIANNWAQDNLKDKFVTLKDITDSYGKDYKYARIFLNNEDLSKFYLKSGLAFYKENTDYYDYHSYFNHNQIKLNSQEISKLNFVILNQNSGIYHKINC